VGIVAIYFIRAMFLPKSYTLTRSTVVNVYDSVVYKNIVGLNEFMNWNPWKRMDPTAKVTISGPEAQPGQVYSWEGEATGKGQMLITAVEPNKSVSHLLTFYEPMEGASNNIFTLAPSDGGTKVAWTLSGENKINLDKWMGLATDMMMGPSFEDGLGWLKKIVEKD
jgi:hypothetical protein